MDVLTGNSSNPVEFNPNFDGPSVLALHSADAFHGSATPLRQWRLSTILHMISALVFIFSANITVLLFASHVLTPVVGEQLLAPLNLGLIVASIYHWWNQWVLDEPTRIYESYVRGYAHMHALAQTLAPFPRDVAARTDLQQAVCRLVEMWLPLYRRDVPGTFRPAHADERITAAEKIINDMWNTTDGEPSTQRRLASTTNFITEVLMSRRVSRRAVRMARHTQIYMVMALHFFVVLPITTWLNTGSFIIAAALTPPFTFIFLFKGIFWFVVGSPFEIDASEAWAYWESPFNMDDILRDICNMPRRPVKFNKVQ